MKTYHNSTKNHSWIDDAGEDKQKVWQKLASYIETYRNSFKHGSFTFLNGILSSTGD